MKSLFFISGIALLISLSACAQNKSEESFSQKTTFPMVKTEAEWKKILTPQQFYVLREKGTETAFTGTYWDNHEKGNYVCAGCGQILFSSDSKFDSGTGWPSFWQPVSKEAVEELKDTSHGMVRTEVVCGNCGGHLGHIFEDGPKPTGMRYCINSVSLSFKEK